MKKLLFLLMIIGFYACSEDLTDNVLPNQDKAANKQEIMTRSAMLANESVEPTGKSLFCKEYESCCKGS